MSDAGLIGGAGNQFVIDFLNSHNIADVPGDVLEIGVFTGGTTRFLAQWAQEHDKRVVAVDPFDTDYDTERRFLYRDWLADKKQFEEFKKNTEGLPVDVVMTSSGSFFLSRAVYDRAFCAAFVDGNHTYAEVRNDLHKAWLNLRPGGVMLVHDYGHDIPDVTRACDEFRTLAGNGGMTVEVLPQFVMIAFIKAANHVG